MYDGHRGVRNRAPFQDSIGDTDEAECSLEWNRLGENARILKNPMPLAAVRPLAFGTSDAIDNLIPIRRLLRWQFVRVEFELASLVFLHLEGSLNQNPSTVVGPLSACFRRPCQDAESHTPKAAGLIWRAVRFETSQFSLSPS